MQPLERADVVALLTGVPRPQPVRVIPVAESGPGQYYVGHMCAYPEQVNGLTWVRRNEDKSHRCPCCHAVATWDKRTHGPRTRTVCPRGCGVQWRLGGRSTRELSLRWSQLETGGRMPRNVPRFVEHSSTGRRRRGHG